MFAGCDPDLHCTSLAVVNSFGEVQGVWLAKVSRDLTGNDAVVSLSDTIPEIVARMPGVVAVTVESQEMVYAARIEANPRDLIPLASVSGIVLACFPCTKYLPKPSEWKGSVPKVIHHGRMLRALDWPYEIVGAEPRPGQKDNRYCRPTEQVKFPLECDQPLPGQWKHVMDAIAMAVWCRERYTRGAAQAKRFREMGLTTGKPT